MRIVITGGAGFLGQLLTRALLAARDEGRAEIPPFDEILSLDLAPSAVADRRVRSAAGDIADPAFVAAHVGPGTAAVFHLAAVVSGQAEADFDLGMRINLDGTRLMLDAARALPAPPKFVFASSLAVFGGPLPETVGDAQALVPASSYGAQKAMGELLVADCARRGFVDGVAVRLPTVVVRPGRPNAAASSFASGIIREPLAGVPAVCPVPHGTRLWLSSPDVVVANLVHALALPPQRGAAAVNLPGLSVTVGEMLDSLARVGGPAARALVRDEPDLRIAAIVCSWPGAFDVTRALSLGFRRDAGFDAVVRQYARAHAPGAGESP